jgi:hypothetical protein
MVMLTALLICIYTLTNAGRYHIIDEVSLFAVTESLATRGSIDTNAIAWSQWVNSPGEVLGAFGVEGEVYSKKGPAPAFLAVPWYALLHLLTHFPIEFGQLQGTLLWNGLVTAITAALLWETAARLGYSERTGALLALLFGLCTIAWPYANHFFGEPLSALSLLSCFYGILAWRQTRLSRWLWLAGLGGGIAIATVTAHALLVGILALYLLYQFVDAWQHVDREDPLGELAWQPSIIATALAFALPIVLCVAALLWYNFTRFASPFDTGYHFGSGEGFSTPLWQGLWGLLFSPYRGVFWHTPLFAATLLAAPAFARRHRSQAIVILALSLALILLYSMWWMWWGGFAWGPRFLVPLTPFWVLLLAPLLEKTATPEEEQEAPASQHLSARLFLLLPLAILSFFVQMLAVVVNYVNYEQELRAIFPTDWNDPLKFGPPAQRLTDFVYSPVFGQWRLLRHDFWGNSDLPWLRSDGDIQWLLLFVGAAAVTTLLWWLTGWWRTNADTSAEAPGRPVVVFAALLPALVIGAWLASTSNDPLYGQPQQGYRAALQNICQNAKESDAVVTIAPTSYHIAMNWMPGVCHIGLPVFGYAADSATHPENEDVLERLLQRYQRIWLVTGGLQPSDPENTVERWLANHAFKASDDWFDDYRLLQYATPLPLAGTPATAINTLLSDGNHGLTIITAKAPVASRSATILPVEIVYRVERPVDENLRWFVQLLTPQGQAVALLDTAPNDNYTPFTQLPAGELLVERAAIYIPKGVRPGEYRLIAGLYRPDAPGQPRLVSADGKDALLLGFVALEE